MNIQIDITKDELDILKALNQTLDLYGHGFEDNEQEHFDSIVEKIKLAYEQANP